MVLKELRIPSFVRKMTGTREGELKLTHTYFEGPCVYVDPQIYKMYFDGCVVKSYRVPAHDEVYYLILSDLESPKEKKRETRRIRRN